MSLARAAAGQQMALLPTLPDFPIRGNAHARNAYGSAAQEIICAALRLNPIPINGSHETNFDAEQGGMFWEIKSVRRGCKVVVYDWRIEKEMRAAVPLKYAVLVHGVSRAQTGGEMWRRFRDDGLRVLILPATGVHAAALAEPRREIKLVATASGKRNGYQRKGYQDGYRNVPVAKLAARVQFRNVVTFDLHGERFAAEVHE